jgi:hypothetical protein
MTPHDKPDDSIAAPRAETHGEFSIFMPEPAKRPGLAARQVLLAGVAAACLLGVGLGLWARPAMSERQASIAAPAAAAPKAAPAARRLAIVVDDRPAPLGAPIDVLPTAGLQPPQAAAPQAPPAVSAPTRLPEGLMRVQNIVSPEPAPPQPAPAAAPAPDRKPALAPLAATAASALAAAKLMLVKARAHDETPAEVAQPKVAQLKVAKAEAPPMAVQKPAHKAAAKAAAQAMADAQAAHRAAAHKVELARAAQAKATAHKLELAQAAQAHKLELAQAAQAHRLELAQAAQAKAQAHRLQLAQTAQEAKAGKQARLQAAKAQRQQQIELAKAEAKGRAEALADAKAQALAEARADERKRERLAALAHAVQRLLPHEAKAPPPVEVAKLDRRHAKKSRHELRIEQASLRTHRPPRLVEPPPVRTRVVPAPPPRASGLMRVSAPRCANRDPGEALVCADPSLGAADRQMTRAYQVARAAGVPDAQLQRQQQRWLAARSAAAREAPWAVHDVYLARIAELNGQARDADEDGH